MKQIKNELHVYNWLLLLVILAHTAFTFCYFLFFKYYQLSSSVIDLGYFDQQIWTFAKYGFPYTSLNQPYEVSNALGFHFSPILGVFSLIYKVYPKIEMLNLVQSFCLAFAAWPLYRVWLKLGGEQKPGLVWVAIYLLNPFILNTAFWDFHEQSLAVPVFAFAFLFCLEKRFAPFVVCMVLLLLTKEHYGIAVFGFGLTWAVINNDKKSGGAVALMGLVSFVVIVFYIMPALYGLEDHVMFTDSGKIGRYNWIMSGDVAVFIKGFKTVAVAAIFYVLALFVPVAGLALLAIALLFPGAADFLVNTLSIYNMPKSVESYHSCTLVVVIMVAAMYGLLNHKKLNKQKMTLVSLALTLVMFYFWSPYNFPMKKKLWDIAYVSDEQVERNFDNIEAIQNLLVEEDSVSVQENIGMHFARRKEVYPFPVKYKGADYIIVHMYYPFASAKVAPFSNMSLFWESLKYVGIALTKDGYGIVYWKDNWLVLKKGAVSRREDVEAVRDRAVELFGWKGIRGREVL